MHRTTVRVALVAALFALLAIPATAAQAADPGGYPVVAAHSCRMSPTVTATIGLQRNSAGQYRVWLRVRGDGRRTLAASFSEIRFYDHGYRVVSRGATSLGSSTGALYYAGTFRYPGEMVSARALGVKARYIGGPATAIVDPWSYRYLTPGGQVGSPSC